MPFSLAERLQLESIQQKFSKEFEAISNKLIVENASRFNQQSTENLDKLLAPLKETLGAFKTSLDSTRQETATNSVLLKEQIGRISMEAANLGDSAFLILGPGKVAYRSSIQTHAFNTPYQLSKVPAKMMAQCPEALRASTISPTSATPC